MSLVRARAELVLDFGDAALAVAIHEALAPENGTYARTRVDGTRLVATAEADAIMRLLRTVDDILADASAGQGAGAVARDP